MSINPDVNTSVAFHELCDWFYAASLEGPSRKDVVFDSVDMFTTPLAAFIFMHHTDAIVPLTVELFEDMLSNKLRKMERAMQEREFEEAADEFEETFDDLYDEELDDEDEGNF